jgi:hypothetical protein
LLLFGTPLSRISDQELQGLAKRHGFDRLLQASDVAAETWRRNREERHNPGGYLQSLCASLIVPDWYVPYEERKEMVEAAQRQKSEACKAQAAEKEREEAQIMARNELWESLSEEQREEYQSQALADLPPGIAPPMAVTAMAKLLAWEVEHLIAAG